MTTRNPKTTNGTYAINNTTFSLLLSILLLSVHSEINAQKETVFKISAPKIFLYPDTTQMTAGDPNIFKIRGSREIKVDSIFISQGAYRRRDSVICFEELDARKPAMVKLYMRLPDRTFKCVFAKQYEVVNGMIRCYIPAVARYRRYDYSDGRVEFRIIE